MSQKITFGTEEDCCAADVVLGLGVYHTGSVTFIVGFFLIFLFSKGSPFSTSLLFYFLLHIFRYINTWKHFTRVSKLPEKPLTFITLGVCAVN